jgi:hypothetical protein
LNFYFHFILYSRNSFIAHTPFAATPADGQREQAELAGSGLRLC